MKFSFAWHVASHSLVRFHKLTHYILEISEKIVYDQLFNFIENNSLISTKQYGFRKKFSIDSLLLHLTSKWRSILDTSSPPLIGVVSLDITKAFDNINHDLLLQKLDSLYNV